MLRTRVLTALVGIPLFLAVLWVPRGWVFAGACSLLVGLGLSEFARVYRQSGGHRYPLNPILLLWGMSLPLLRRAFPEWDLEISLLPALGVSFMWCVASGCSAYCAESGVRAIRCSLYWVADELCSAPSRRPNACNYCRGSGRAGCLVGGMAYGDVMGRRFGRLFCR